MFISEANFTHITDPINNFLSLWTFLHLIGNNNGHVSSVKIVRNYRLLSLGCSLTQSTKQSDSYDRSSFEQDSPNVLHANRLF